MDAKIRRNMAISIVELSDHSDALRDAQLQVTDHFEQQSACSVVLSDRQFIALHGFYVIGLHLMLGASELDTQELIAEINKVRAECEARALINKVSKDHD